MTAEFPISPETWESLVNANKQAVREGWAERGVFATGVGPLYHVGGDKSLLYVGKSPGPLGIQVGSEYEQATSATASTRWMVARQNRGSPFWQFIEQIDPTRRTLAWTNVCKMDVRGGGKAPNGKNWDGVSEICLKALKEELANLLPKVVVFAISDQYKFEVKDLLRQIGYCDKKASISAAPLTAIFSRGSQSAIFTRHPQGWNVADRTLAIGCIKAALA